MLKTKTISTWLDCDPGLDDTFAIIYAARDPKINLIGISTSPGNTCLANTTRNALDVLYSIGRSDIPVISGSNILIKGEMCLAENIHGSNGLGGVQLPRSPKLATTEKSLQKIFQSITSHQNKITWVNTGSLTNLCLILKTYPLIKQKIEKIVIMGGAIGRGNVTPAAQFNVYFDPHAFDQVLKLKGDIGLVMVPLEVTHQNLATQDIIDYFKARNNIPFSNAIYKMLQEFKRMYYECQNFAFPPIHDPCTIFYLLHPEQFQAFQAQIKVDTCESSYGRTNVYFHNLHDKNKNKIYIDKVTTHLKNQKTKFWDEMIKIFNGIFQDYNTFMATDSQQQE